MKKLVTMMVVAAVSIWSIIPANAANALPVNQTSGEWVQDSTGWWWKNPDGSYPKTAWKEINGVWYYFNQDGYMAHDCWQGDYYLTSSGAMATNTTTPDGYKVGADGKWIQENTATSVILQTGDYTTNLAMIVDNRGNTKFKVINDSNNDKHVNVTYVDGDKLIADGVTYIWNSDKGWYETGILDFKTSIEIKSDTEFDKYSAVGQYGIAMRYKKS